MSRYLLIALFLIVAVTGIIAQLVGPDPPWPKWFSVSVTGENGKPCHLELRKDDAKSIIVINGTDCPRQKMAGLIDPKGGPE